MATLNTTPSYTDLPGLTSRANSAMGRIEMIMARTEVSSAARLALIARVMESEPILRDPSTAAHIARREADARGEYAPLPRIEETCCGRCEGAGCYVDMLTNA